MKRFKVFMVLAMMIAVCCNLVACSVARPKSPVEVLVQGDRKSCLVYAYQTLSEAEKYKQAIVLQPTGWGRNQRKLIATIACTEQEICSCKIDKTLQLTYSKIGFDTLGVDQQEFVSEASNSISIEAWLNCEQTPNVVLEICLSDGTSWYAIVEP